MATPVLLTPKETAAFLQVSEQTLMKWRSKGTGPQFTRLGHRTVRYLLRDRINCPAWSAPGSTQGPQQ